MLPESDRAVWDRVLSRTMSECDNLLKNATTSLQALAEETLALPKDTVISEYHAAVRNALVELMDTSVDEASHPKDRRKAFTALQTFLAKVRTAVAPNESNTCTSNKTGKKRIREQTETEPNVVGCQRKPKAGKVLPDLEGLVLIPFSYGEKYGFTISLPHLLMSPPSTPAKQRRTFCKLCNVWFPATGQKVALHCNGRTHTSHLDASQGVPIPQLVASRFGFESSLPFLFMTSSTDPNYRVRCMLCQLSLGSTGQEIAAHCQGPQHRGRMETSTSKQCVAPSVFSTTERPKSVQSDSWARAISGQTVHAPTVPARMLSRGPTANNTRGNSSGNGVPSLATPLHQTAPTTKRPPQLQSGCIPIIPLAFASGAPTNITITAHADTKRPTFSCTILPRPSPVKVTFKQILQAPLSEVENIRGRFSEWDPFCSVVFEMGIGVTSPVLKTHPNFPAIQSAGVWFFDLENARTMVQHHSFCEVIMRMIPRKAVASKKRADCHLWPKGTLLQIDSKPVEIEQRKQQSHNHNEWKRVCLPLNLTSAVAKAHKRQERLEIALTAHDADKYVCQVCVCKRVTPKELCAKILQERQLISFPDSAASVAKAMNIAAKSMSLCVVDGDGGDDNGGVADAAPEQGRFVFSLLCPLTKKPIVTPVRGKHCKHWQCFDLESFLNINNVVSGTRWRCGACEQFVSLRSLEHCPLTAKVLKTYADEVKSDQDRVEFRADGTYELLSKRKKRYKSEEQQNDQPNRTNLADGSGGGGHQIITLD